MTFFENPPQPASAPAFSLEDLDYDLPPELIAQRPSAQRDQARLLVFDPNGRDFHDDVVARLGEYLRPGDLLVLNDTRVAPARFHARRSTGGRVEGLFLQEIAPGRWEVMLKNVRRRQVGETLEFLGAAGTQLSGSGAPSSEWVLKLVEPRDEGRWIIDVHPALSAWTFLEAVGYPPRPPYIKRPAPGEVSFEIHEEGNVEEIDRERYQTVYARAHGSVAAPTAGLHFTQELFDRLEAKGIGRTFITLHVGVGTFKPIAVDHLADHVMHEERFELSEKAVETIRACKARGGRVVAVGTTSARVLESAADERGDPRGRNPAALRPRRGATRLFIHPPFRFRVVDALLTNFHLPRSTLLALVMALAGVERTRHAYRHALAVRYRFYSYGDATLVFPPPTQEGL